MVEAASKTEHEDDKDDCRERKNMTLSEEELVENTYKTHQKLLKQISCAQRKSFLDKNTKIHAYDSKNLYKPKEDTL